MPMSTYYNRLRACVGHDRLLSPGVAAAIHELGAFGGQAFRHVYPNGDQAEYLVLLFA